MEFTNGDKSRHGVSAQNSIDDLLSLCVRRGYLSGFERTYRVGMAGYGNATQFYAPFLLSFEDGDQWLIFSSTSMRTDRIKGQQWDAFNIKQINTGITAAYLVYPDILDICDIDEFKRQNDKYACGYEFSAIDGILSHNQLFKRIESHALQDLNIGQVKDLKGRIFEDKVAATLSYSENLIIWLTGDHTLVGLNYPMFDKIISSFCLQGKPVKIWATTSKEVIKKLPSGGNPKTDVYVEVTYNDDTRQIFTISCKRSNSSSVSVHQYTADTFADVLDKDNEALRKYLNIFQAAGSLSEMGTEAEVALTHYLFPYRFKLALWVLGGRYGDGNPSIQWASHILTYNDDDDTLSIHTVTEYCALLRDNGVRGHFGTFFSWTYPSKRRGQSIQLKCTII